jgi:hypothetical protein
MGEAAVVIWGIDMKLPTLLVGMTGALALTLAASAAEAKSWDFSFTSTGPDTASGTFTTTNTGPTYTVTDITGTIDGSTITGLSSYAGADQLLFMPGPPNFDVGGISFSALDGISYNLTDFPDGSNRITNSVYDPPGVGTPEPFQLTSLTITAVPESATWLMMVMGVAAIGAGLRMGRGRQLANA